MLVLAIDTALGACACCVLDVESGHLVASQSLPMARGHAEALMPVIAEVMAQAGVAFADLDRIAVTTGPGSFTGLRVGLSAARGIALAASKPVVGVTTLTAYSAPYISETGRDPVICAIDARHDQVYCQVVSGNGTPLVRPKLKPISELLEAARFGAPVLIGNAAEMIAARWPAELFPVTIDAAAAPSIEWVAWVGAALNPEQALPRPTYLRAPDAKPQAPMAHAPALP
jgi:tRNA threonylcarbamoyladenosine biosynthesis protein TsaB